MSPDNTRLPMTEDLTTCASCGGPSTGWADVGRTAVGVCDRLECRAEVAARHARATGKQVTA